MAIRFAPPWLKALGGLRSPLKDDAWVHDDLAKMRAQAEQQDRARQGELFAGPMLAPPQPSPHPAAAINDILPDEPSPDRMRRPVLPPTPVQAPLEQTSAAMTQVTGAPSMPPAVIAPPGAPPPPPPVDRPPGTFDIFHRPAEQQ